MIIDEEIKQNLIKLGEKEMLLAQIVGWLKGKGLWDECKKSLDEKQ